jgi:archaeosine-15-forming tRNA-guanine transglycosylase
MDQSFGEWEIVARKTNNPIRHLIGIVLQMFLMAQPATFSSMTWTLRNSRTGETRKVTAKSETEAALRATDGEFDP